MLTDDIAEAEKAKNLLAGVGPILDGLKAAYKGKLTDVALSTPWKTQELMNLATAVKVVEAVQGQLIEAIANGRLAEHDLSWAAQVAKITPTKRWLGIGW